MNFPRWKMFTEAERKIIAAALSGYFPNSKAAVLSQHLLGELRGVDLEEGPTVAEAKATGQLDGYTQMRGSGGVMGYVADLPQCICNLGGAHRCPIHGFQRPEAKGE